MMSLLNAGTTLIVDRYSFSGIAFSAAKEGMDLKWCQNPETGLPKPDLVFMLNLDTSVMMQRGDFGSERYEVLGFQEKVRNNFLLLQDATWRDLSNLVNVGWNSSRSQVRCRRETGAWIRLWPVGYQLGGLGV
uniref:dTMP kinase n=1 Tax=Timema monikensis TaxID=170555 RepID=A0A7R9EEC1_9NEOP|nr:unnamed protein product [Timema monikensis]